MRISIIGPNTPIPPVGWGAVESLIWDMKLSLTEMGHDVQIVNVGDPNKIIEMINQYSPDFVHFNYDDFIGLYPYINYPKACTTHFAYIQRPEMMGPYKQRVFDLFTQIKPNVFGLSSEINKVYHDLSKIPENNLYLNPNGVNGKLFNFVDNPKYVDQSIYLAKIDSRKRQYLFQTIDSLWYAGNIEDDKFDTSKNYLGEWNKETLYENLTQYGNLVLLSDGEAHPLVCMEAFAAGLGVVVSEYATANLDLSKNFITVIPEDKIKDLKFVEEKIIQNREYSVKNREEILDYAKQFEWCKILNDYYLPNVEEVIQNYKNISKNPVLMDKNKSTYKLKGIGPIYYLNLDGQPERQQYMETQFKYWEIENYTRISAYDGRDDDLSDIITGRYPEMMTSGEIGCVTSHLKAIKHWYDTSDSPYAIIMEDDCNLDLVKYWNFTWQDFFANIPYDWDVVQIAIICTGDIHVKLHKRFVNDFSTACYLINRHHAEKLLKFHIKGNKYRLDNGVKPRPVADDLIYNSGNTYSIPLLLYRTELGSSIHPEHIDMYHKANFQALSQFWEQNGASVDIKEYMNYDPYIGRITENSSKQ
jgi:hypothetical protein